MTPTIKSKCSLSKINEAISNSTLAAVTVISLVLGGVSISGIMDNPDSLKKVFLILESKVHVGSVMNVNYNYDGQEEESY